MTRLRVYGSFTLKRPTPFYLIARCIESDYHISSNCHNKTELNIIFFN